MRSQSVVVQGETFNFFLDEEENIFLNGKKFFVGGGSKEIYIYNFFTKILLNSKKMNHLGLFKQKFFILKFFFRFYKTNIIFRLI